MTDLQQPNRLVDRGFSTAIFVPARTRPRYLAQNATGILGECTVGDLVVLSITPEITSRTRSGIPLREGDVVLGSVGWVDPPDVFVCISDPSSWEWKSDSAHLKCLPDSTPCRFFALRPGKG